MQIGNQVAEKFYGTAIGASQPSPLDQEFGGEAKSQGFTETVVDAAKDVVETLAKGEETSKAMMAGKADAHSVVEALAATEMALEMAVTVRDKVVEAYQEILRMPL